LVTVPLAPLLNELRTSAQFGVAVGEGGARVAVAARVGELAAEADGDSDACCPVCPPVEELAVVVAATECAPYATPRPVTSTAPIAALTMS
jgi:hypothetical protein